MNECKPLVAGQFARGMYKFIEANHQHWIAPMRAWLDKRSKAAGGGGEAPGAGGSGEAPSAGAGGSGDAPVAEGGGEVAGGGGGEAAAARPPSTAARPPPIRQTNLAAAVTAACPSCTSSMTCADCAAMLY